MGGISQTDAIQLAAFGCVDGIGRKTLQKLVKYRRERGWTWREIWVPSAEISTFLSLSQKQIHSIQNARTEHFVTTISDGISAGSFRLITTESEEYPPLLRESDDLPPVLFAKGAVLNWTAESLPIAIVGTRNITPYGREVTELLAGELVVLGATIVSGLMYGVDSVAHLTAVKCAGSTIAVLGYGFDHCYPEEHRPVMEELLARGATLLSEYPPWKIAKRGNFPARNSIVAGMSAAVVVTEAAQKSGSMITAECAVEEGRAVCAVPGPITNPYCDGTKWLINQGATLVSSGAEVLEQIYRPGLNDAGIHLKIEPSPEASQSHRATSRDSARSARRALASVQGQCILDQLATTGLTGLEMDELLEQTGLPQSALLVELTGLELLGLIERTGSQWCLK